MNELQISNQELSRLADEVIGLAKEYWESVEQRPAYPVTSGKQTTELFARPWAEEGRGREVLQDFKSIAEHARPSGGKFFAYVLGSGEPVGALGELLAAALNQNVTSWRSAPAAITIEHAVVGWMAEAVGCAGFSGSLCGGGSSANLMALAMAREAKLPANETGARPGIVYASEQVHMSIPKAIALLGLGRKNLRLIPIDGEFRMRTDALQAAIAADRQAGHVPIAIVATAGTVNTGAIDPLPEIADLAQREGLWLHVDGAFGGLAALAAPEKYRGMERADTLSIDAHKWLYQPLDCGCLLHRHRDVARAAFSHTDDYVKILTGDSWEGYRGLRGVDGTVAALPRAEALDVAAVSRAPGLSRRHRAGPAPCPASGGTGPRAAGAGADGAGAAQRRLLPPPREGQRVDPEAGQFPRPRLSVERDDPRPVRAARLLRQSPGEGG